MEEAEQRERFEALAPTLVEPLRRFLARRTDLGGVDDVLAETLLVVWRRLDDVPESTDHALPWAYAAARNCLANAARSARRQGRLAERLAREPSAPSPAHPALEDAWERLRPEDAELLRLWAWERLQPAEIAVVLGLTPNAVSIRLHRAKQRLRKILAAAGHEPGERRTP